jgi:methylated-DNA-protein-cysteine methyltransferase-like protein
MRDDSAYREKVYRLVRRIPAGRVMTYGQIAELMGDGYTPRTVGFVMHNSDDTTPWHRVINAQGACSTRGLLLPHDKQQRLLEAEGVRFDERGRCNLQTYLWIPEGERAGRETKSEQHSLFKESSSRAKDKT